MSKQGQKERTVKFFEYGEFISPEYMQSLIGQAQPYKRGKIKNAKLVFSGRNCGIVNILKDPDSYVYGMVYEIPINRLSSLSRKRVNYYKPKTVVVKVKLENGKTIKALTIMSQEPTKQKLPSADYYARMAEGYINIKLNKRRLDYSVEKVPVNTTFQPKLKGR